MDTMNTNQIKKNKSQLYAGIIWIISAIALALYGLIFFFNSQVPGMGELVSYLSSIDNKYIYLAAFISVFIEGLYFIGSFFPGASFVIILAIISGASGYVVFSTTLFLIFIGWSLAGIINIYFAKVYRDRIVKLMHTENYNIKDRVWTTWFPSFRSSYEVAQVIEGGHPVKVYISSLRVRFWATLFVGLLALIIPLIMDVDNTSDKESFVTILIILLISLIVGIVKVRKYFRHM
jgi:membrane protein DedA with SNARE-associated domain